MLSFNDFDLIKPLLTAVAELGYETPTPVQEQTIPLFLGEDNLLVQAQTGTGKTAAFALPILSKINLRDLTPQALILTPTRELCLQVAEAFQSYAKHLKDFHVLPIYGGQNFQQQLRTLKRGVHVIVGTPGRVIDHLEKSTIKTTSLKIVVLDEADEMLKMGFIDDVDWILKQFASVQQMALFSATLPVAIKKISERYLTNPKIIEIKSKHTKEVKIEQCHVIVSRNNKLDALTRFLDVEPLDGAIIFTRTKTASSELTEKLTARGFAVAALNGDMNQAHRERVIKQMKSEAIDIIVATDVAARGIDIERISHVINFDAPHDIESYIHRIGRTGRAGRVGKAIIFIAPNERRILSAIERETKHRTTELSVPTNQQISKVRQQQFAEKVMAVLADAKVELGDFEETISKMCHDQEHTPLTIAAALAYMLNKPRKADASEQQQAASGNTERGERSRNSERGRDRGERDRGDRSERGRGRERDENKPVERGMVRCKINLGHQQQITPRQIVGLIANKADISSKYIGEISIFDDYSLIDLDEEIAADVLKSLGKIKLRGGVFHLKQAS